FLSRPPSFTQLLILRYLKECIYPAALHSFPTRRSSDLSVEQQTSQAVESTKPILIASTEPSNTIPKTVSEKPKATEPPKTANTTDRKSTRLNSSHVSISYAVFCLTKKITMTDRSSKRTI